MNAPSSLVTGDLCDAHKTDHDGAFRVLAPHYTNFGGRARFAGSVSTVRCFEDNTSVKAALEEPGHGRVLVVDGGGSLRRALVGGNIAAAAVRNGWAGIVVDGCVRDRAELAPCAIGILARALMPMPSERRRDGERDIGIEVYGVRLQPGEWLVADEDGVVVMPQRPV